MKRTPLKARKFCTRCKRTLCRCGRGLERGGGLKRRTKVRPVNPERKQRLFGEGFGSEARVRWVASLACVVPGCDGGPCENAHTVSRGSGGKARDVVPMCPAHHTEQHQLGIRTFASKYGLDLESEAAATERAWQEREVVE